MYMGCGAVWGWIALQNLNKQTFETIYVFVAFLHNNYLLSC
jgi:hypothetical protein